MILFLLMGAVCAASDIDSLKAPKGFSEFKNGTFTFEKNNQTCYLFLDKIGSEKFRDLESKYKGKIKYKELGNNTYSFSNEDQSTAGVIEKVKIDNEDYVVYTLFEGKNKLSKGELKLSKKALKSFNDKNNLTAESDLKNDIMK